MANSKQATKRVRQAERSRRHNASRRSLMRTLMKQVIKAVGAKDLSGAQASYAKLVKYLDRFATRGLIHKNKAARHKQRLNSLIKSIA